MQYLNIQLLEVDIFCILLAFRSDTWSTVSEVCAEENTDQHTEGRDRFYAVFLLYCFVVELK